MSAGAPALERDGFAKPLRRPSTGKTVRTRSRRARGFTSGRTVGKRFRKKPPSIRMAVFVMPAPKRKEPSGIGRAQDREERDVLPEGAYMFWDMIRARSGQRGDPRLVPEERASNLALARLRRFKRSLESLYPSARASGGAASRARVSGAAAWGQESADGKAGRERRCDLVLCF